MHKWLALPLGVFMAILCFTGFLLLVIKDISPLLGMEEGVEPFYKAVKQLHRWLFMVPNNPYGGLSVGRVIMAVSSMCMALVLLTGVVVWWPKTKKMLKSRLKVSTNKGFRRFVYDTHVSLGIYAFVFLFLMAITGPVFSFGWYRQGMSKLFGQNAEKMETKMPKGDGKQAATKQNAFAHDNTDRVKEHAQRQEGGAPETKKDGDGKKPGGKKLFKSLHTGKWAGWFSRVLYAIAALVGGFLPISGYYLWWKKRQGKRTK
ncbi:MAG: PepSY-associated TM helix domain-containing protein [Prevotella conceptionensis]